MKYFMVIAASIVAMFSVEVIAQEEGVRKQIDSDVSQWATTDVVISAINAQNTANAVLTQGEIDTLDKQWRAEVKSGSGPLVDKVLNNDLSKFLQGIKEKSQGLYTEIFVMDNKGLNVGQSDPTSDYWQGDEAKWQKTFLVGAGAVDISEVEFDESSQIYQVQASIPIMSGDTVIGAITIGMNAELLE